ncbi:ABC transporter permease [Spirochaeta africana]|uniref:ABC-type dipeptide/oligopeptide/nickel transport system, permease component n=1 Tax=Spirochaeta africana (strain ATCC 700263 / DSM 8902 / Z-7692) TaxID=889378 RepID=H9UKS7_SPIAZ|nr:ABC transporter permease [Spirochaeta africana]AFG38120.1 ABC-type dipeptide/oligopeptide/nickel transport system, permease component [Spirochaeta africana DSM 8902]
MSEIQSGSEVTDRAAQPVSNSPEADSSKRQTNEFHEVFRHLLRNRIAVAGLIIIGVFLVLSIFAPYFATHSPTATSLGNRLQGPSSEHWFGTDELGRDLFSRMLYGGRISMNIGVISTLIGLLIGVPIGAVSGYYGGKLDMIIQRFIDMLIAFPGILLAIVVVTVLGVGVQNVMIAVGIASVPLYARLVRGSVLAAKEQSYVTAAAAAGLRDWRIIFRHILPNCLAPIIVQSTFQIATAILWAAGLGFLGLGAQAPTPEWGAILSNGRAYIRSAHHLTTIPGIAILLMVLGFNLIGDGLRDALDPKTR